MPTHEIDPDSQTRQSTTPASLRASPVLPPIVDHKQRVNAFVDATMEIYLSHDDDDDEDGHHGEDLNEQENESDEERDGSHGSRNSHNDDSNGLDIHSDSGQRHDSAHSCNNFSHEEQRSESENNSDGGSMRSNSRESSQLSIANVPSERSTTPESDRFLDVKHPKPERRSFMDDKSIRAGSAGSSGCHRDLSESPTNQKSPEPMMTSHPHSRIQSRTSHGSMKSPPPGLFPVKRRPHVMDIDYDPVLDTDFSQRPKPNSPDNLESSSKSAPSSKSSSSSGAIKVAKKRSIPRSRENTRDSQNARDFARARRKDEIHRRDFDDEEDSCNVQQRDDGGNPTGREFDETSNNRRGSDEDEEHNLRRHSQDTANNDNNAMQQISNQPTFIRPESQTSSIFSSHRIGGGSTVHSDEEDPEYVADLLLPPEIRIQKASTGFQSSLGASSVMSSARRDPETIIFDSDEYDTELEDEFEPPSRPPSYFNDLIAYESRCVDLEVPPQQLILRSLKEPALVLSQRNLGPTAIRAMVAALKKNTVVTLLELERTGLGPEGAGYVARMLHNNQFISYINLEGNEIGESGTVAISEMLCINKGLLSINLAGNRAGEFGAEALAVALKLNNRLVDLNISRNDLGEVGAILLGKSIGLNESLVKLNLSWNHIRMKGAVAICKGLQANSNLVEVDLSWNGLGYEGSLALSNMIKHNTSIRVLDISNNRINWQGALLLTKGLKVNYILEELKMGCNPLTTTGCMDIIQAIAEAPHTAISFLSLKNVMVVGEFEMETMLIRQQRPEFRYEHGGIVNSHDVLGQRRDKKIDPMQRVMNFMKEKELRVTEFFRAFDKSVGNKLDVNEFRARLQKAGITMANFEVEELISTIVGKATKQKGDDINVGKMMKSVEDQVRKERMEKINEREKKEKIKKYHKNILNDPNIKHVEESLSDSKSQFSGISGPRTMSGYQSPLIAGSHGSIKRSPLSLATKPSGVLSMGGELGTKPKEFGTIDKKKKKKKKRKK